MSSLQHALDEAKERGETLRKIRTLIDFINVEKLRVRHSGHNRAIGCDEGGALPPLDLLIAREIGLHPQIVELLDVHASEFGQHPFDIDFMADDHFIDPDLKPVFDKVKQKLDELDIKDPGYVRPSNDLDGLLCLENLLIGMIEKRTVYLEDQKVSGIEGDILFEIAKDRSVDGEESPFDMYDLTGRFYVEGEIAATVHGDWHFSSYDLDDLSTDRYVILMDMFSDHDADFASAVGAAIDRGEMSFNSVSELYDEDPDTYCSGNVVKWRSISIEDRFEGTLDPLNAFEHITDALERVFPNLSMHTVEKLAYLNQDEGNGDVSMLEVTRFNTSITDLLYLQEDEIRLVACASELHRIALLMNGTRRFADLSIEDSVLKVARQHVLLNDLIKRKQAKSQGSTQYYMCVLNPAKDCDPDRRLGETVLKTQAHLR